MHEVLLVATATTRWCHMHGGLPSTYMLQYVCTHLDTDGLGAKDAIVHAVTQDLTLGDPPSPQGCPKSTIGATSLQEQALQEPS